MQNRQLHLLVTPYQNRKMPVYRWYNYNHSFSRDLVIRIIEKFNLASNDKILDPFCGTGTTLLACKEMGISSIGIDILPLSVFISNAKVIQYDDNFIKKSILEIKNIIKFKNYKYVTNMREEILGKYFQSKTLFHIILVNEWCRIQRSKQLKYFFLTALMSILEKLSYARKDGGFLRILPKKKTDDFFCLFFNKIEEMLKDIKFLNNLPSVYSQAVEGDARQIRFEDEEFSAIITSPPYLNRHDYTRVYMLELFTCFIDSNDSLKNLRYRTLRSHVEAKKMFDSNAYITPQALSETLKELIKRPLPNRQVIKMIKGYFEDIYIVLKECKRVVKKKGKIAFVIGDVRYGGIKIPVNDILLDLGNRINLSLKEKIVARIRGNSPQQMGKYGKDPVEECILVWEKK